MTAYTVADLEDAIIVRLQDRLGAYVRTIDSYQGEMEDSPPFQSRRLPAALVRLQQTNAHRATRHSLDLEVVFDILVVDRNLRGNRENRRAPGGVYQMLEDVRQALADQDLGLEIEPLRLLREEALSNNREKAMYVAVYATRLIRDT
jgi:phage gp37-like protein